MVEVNFFSCIVTTCKCVLVFACLCLLAWFVCRVAGNIHVHSPLSSCNLIRDTPILLSLLCSLPLSVSHTPPLSSWPLLYVLSVTKTTTTLLLYCVINMNISLLTLTENINIYVLKNTLPVSLFTFRIVFSFVVCM